MRIERITLTDYPPIKNIDIQITSNLVIIAGANGSGKTRLKEAILYPFATAHESQISLLLRVTTPDEESILGQDYLQIHQGKISPSLRNYLQTRTEKKAFSGSIIQIESNRTVRSVQFQSITSSTPDPDEQGLDYSLYLDNLSNRWNKLVNNLYAKSAIRNDQLIRFLNENPDKTYADAAKAIPDPLEPFQKTFSNLFPDKKLEPIDVRFLREFQYKDKNAQTLSFGSLSSGEQELVTMVFDLIYRDISHSIIIIDEPELHLHPLLTFRFIETLKQLGSGTNQVILFTHSADLISSYYSTGNVFLIDSNSNEENQAHLLSKLNEKHSEVARIASTNLGMFAVGKNLILVEGKTDRLIYSKIAQDVFPHFQIIPVNSVQNIVALRSVIDELDNNIFGVGLFFIRDRDGLSAPVISSLEKNPRFRCIPRRHIENYLFDPEVLNEVANTLNIKSEPQKIQEVLHKLATKNLMAGVLWNVSEQIRTQSAPSLPKIKVDEVTQTSFEYLKESFATQIAASIKGVHEKFDKPSIENLISEEHKKLSVSLSNGKWQELLPGKLIFNQLCSVVFNAEPQKIQDLYTTIAIKKKPEVFQEIINIFQVFSELKL